MPTLQFKGKAIIWNHHLAIPYHTLDEVPELHVQPVQDAGNLLVEGDNLIALKALLPLYGGRIKCIYIDPPYNTGNEGWVYNDAVNSPMITDWLGKEVGKDDLTRHDKWLCMMVPRLKLLRELLREDGVVYVSIDDDEQHHLRMAMDEIFGKENFITNIIWQKKFSPQNDAKYFSDNHDFILCYAKNKLEGESRSGWKINLLPRTEKMEARYRNPDNDPRGDWTSGDVSVKTYSKEYDYPITTPSGKVVHPPKGACWRFSKEKLRELIVDNRVWFGEDGSNVPRLKRFITDVKQGLVPVTIWEHSEVGHNQQAKQELKALFDEEDIPFDTPKPVSLLKRILQLSTDKDSIVLDAFAGSGTTAHAVLDLNREDGGNRRFILIQMPEASAAELQKNICKDITRERIARAIARYNYAAGFRYYRTGAAMDAETMLGGELPSWTAFARYVWHLATGSPPAGDAGMSGADYFVGAQGSTAVYLIYTPDAATLGRLALDSTLAAKMKATHPGSRIIVYAPACWLEEDYLQEAGISFVSVPYNLFERG